MRHNLFLLGSFLLLTSCNSSPAEQQKTVPLYFDLKGYFEKEALRLQRAQPLVSKSVSINGSEETKSLKIANWKAELAAIADADINKASWRRLFTVHHKNGKVHYTTAEEKIPVKEVIVAYSQNKPVAVVVLMKASNMLYTSVDSLHYYPDSLYQINKSQHIRLLDSKDYKVTLKFK